MFHPCAPWEGCCDMVGERPGAHERPSADRTRITRWIFLNKHRNQSRSDTIVAAAAPPPEHGGPEIKSIPDIAGKIVSFFGPNQNKSFLSLNRCLSSFRSDRRFLPQLFSVMTSFVLNSLGYLTLSFLFMIQSSEWMGLNTQYISLKERIYSV